MTGMETQQQAEQLRHATIASFNDDESFVSTDELTRRIMSNSNGDEWWLARWRTQRAAAMGLSKALAQFGISTHRQFDKANNVQRKGYLKSDVAGQTPKQWW